MAENYNTTTPSTTNNSKGKGEGNVCFIYQD